MSLVMSICDHVSVLDYGAVIAQGDPATVQADPAVQAAYLGVAEEDPAPPSVAPVFVAASGSCPMVGLDPRPVQDDPLPDSGRPSRVGEADAVDHRRERRLRAHRGRPRGVAGRPRGLGLRAARPQRGRQVDAPQGGERPYAADDRRGLVRGPPRPGCRPPTSSPA